VKQAMADCRNRKNKKITILVNQENLNFVKSIPAKSIGTYLWPGQ